MARTVLHSHTSPYRQAPPGSLDERCLIESGTFTPPAAYTNGGIVLDLSDSFTQVHSCSVDFAPPFAMSTWSERNGVVMIRLYQVSVSIPDTQPAIVTGQLVELPATTSLVGVSGSYDAHGIRR